MKKQAEELGKVTFNGSIKFKSNYTRKSKDVDGKEKTEETNDEDEIIFENVEVAISSKVWTTGKWIKFLISKIKGGK